MSNHNEILVIHRLDAVVGLETHSTPKKYAVST